MPEVRDPSVPSEEDYQNIFNSASDGLIVYDIEKNMVVEANPAACKMHGYSRDEFIGLKSEDFIHPESYAVFTKNAREVGAGKLFEAQILHQRQDGSPFHVEVRRSGFLYQGRLCLLSVLRDVSKRVETENILSRQVAEQLREQAMLLTISHTLASTLELQPGLILDQISEIIEFSQGGLFALEDSSLVTLAMRGTPLLEESAPIRIQLKSADIMETLFNRHMPIRIADVWSDDPQAKFLRGLLDDGAAALLAGMQSWMWVPLAVKNRIIGGVGVAEIRKNHFTSHHADLALSVANQAAITMVNAELYGHAQELAVLEERQRLARNLHDAVNQSLFSAGLIAEVLPRLWDRDPAGARNALNDLRRLTRAAQAEMRALLAELRPSAITDTDLGDLIILLGNAFSGRINLQARVTVAENVILPPEIQLTFYRICQEALNNIAKHAKPNQVTILLKKDNDLVELKIKDDGLGFDPNSIPSERGHYGLNMMRERAEAAGARMTVISQPSHGTELTMKWSPDLQKEPK